MTSFFFGLGNPGDEYAHSRHNAGFMVADAFAMKLGLLWETKPKFFAELAGTPTSVAMLVKPHTFMNDSGKAVSAVLNFYDKEKFALNDFRKVFVCYDDLDIAFGEYKIQFGKHPKIHNGVGSVVRELGSEEFWNVRIGVDTRAGKRELSGKEYVLAHLDGNEQKLLAEVLKNVVQEVHAQIISS